MKATETYSLPLTPTATPYPKIRSYALSPSYACRVINILKEYTNMISANGSYSVHMPSHSLPGFLHMIR